MISGRVERRLAAILVADIEGYSRLMGVDEVGTLAALKAHRRDLFNSAIATHHGRIVKTTGDGVLVEFPSVVDAVGCAVGIQRGMASRNSRVPADKRIVFRVGINVGDIIIDGRGHIRRRRQYRGPPPDSVRTGRALHLPHSERPDQRQAVACLRGPR